MLGPSKNLFGVPVNGFHPQLTAVSNPLRPNDAPPPSWPLYVQPRSNSQSNSTRRFPSGGMPEKVQSKTGISTLDLPSMTSSEEVDARTTVVVRKIQNDVRESDRSRSSLIRKRVHLEEKSNRRHMKKMRRQRRSSETTNVSLSTMSSLSSVATSGIGSISGSESASTRKSYKSTSVTATGSRKGIVSSSSTDYVAAVPNDESVRQDSETHFSTLYSDVFMSSNRPQFMATLGGRLVSWNDEFLSVTGASKTQLRGCMTIHNLIAPSYHRVLNDLFELALRGDSCKQPGSIASSTKAVAEGTAPSPPVVVVAAGETTALSNNTARERQIAAAMAPPSSISLDRSYSPRSDLSDGCGSLDALTSSKMSNSQAYLKDESCVEEDSKELYSSLTLPCSPFSRATEQLQITIVFMTDIDPSRRCFYCVLSPLEHKKIQPKLEEGALSYSSIFLPQPAIPLGIIRSINQEELANLL